MVSTNTNKREYESPRARLVTSHFQGILCQSIEPIDEGGGHEW